MKLDDAARQSFAKLYVRFYLLPGGKLNKRKSEETGSPVYEDVEKVEIRQAGDSKQIAHYNAHDESDYVDENGIRLTYAQVYAGQYRQFKESAEQIDGTRIEVLPGLTPAQISTAKALGCHTVEALAGLDGQNLKNLGMGARDLKNKAMKWLDDREAARSGVSNQAEIDDLKAQIANLQAQLAGGGKPPEADTVDASAFDGFSDDDLRAYLEDNGQKAHPSAKHETLLRKAVEVASEIKGRSEAA